VRRHGSERSFMGAQPVSARAGIQVPIFQAFLPGTSGPMLTFTRG
jgi:hypothetical protein